MESSFAQRLCETVELATNYSPIQGLELVALVGLREAISMAQDGDRMLAEIDLYHGVCAALKYAKHKRQNNENEILSLQEIAAIHLYTQESPFYAILNTRMRDEKRELLRPFLAYIKLLLSGLNRLQPVSALVYRGVKLDLHREFPRGAEPMW